MDAGPRKRLSVGYADLATPTTTPPQRSFRLDLFDRRNVRQLKFLGVIMGVGVGAVVGTVLIAWLLTQRH
jgi:hypothetical protein